MEVTRSPAIIWSLAAVIVVSLAGIAIWFAGAWISDRSRLSGFTESRTPWHLIVGDDALAIPLNHVREAPSGLPAVAKSVNLVFALPDGSGFHEANADIFVNERDTSGLIFASLDKRTMKADMSGRLPGVYLKLFSGLPRPGPAGLRLQKLDPSSGYAAEELVIGDHGNWVARCETETGDRKPTCIRDIHMGKSLSVTYRFDRRRLADWQSIEQLVRRKIGEFILS